MKIAVFGIDGGTLSLIERWKDELPIFKRFLEQGAYGGLESTIPALTCPAWASMFTGKNPGKLGIYDFLHLNLNNEHSRVVNSSDYHNSALWKIVSDYGKTVGVLNAPMTYPPHQINGYMVCGLGTPEKTGVNFTYPLGLQLELNELVGEYKITPNVLITLYGQEKKCLLNVKELLQKRMVVAKYLIKNYPCDLFTFVFFVSDIIQHYFWRYMDTSHPRYVKSPYEDAVKDIYKEIDSCIGELIPLLPDSNILLVSDHGFGSCFGGLSINRWLEKKGYLKFKDGVNNRGRLYRLRDILLSHTSSGMVDTLLKVIPKSIIRKLTTSGEALDIVKTLINTVDWSQTRAYVLGTSGGGIFVNVKGRQPFGIVSDSEEYEKVRSDVISDLEEFGLKAFRKEEIYSGEYLKDAPDVAIELGSGNYYPITLDRHSVLINYAASGAHIPQGMFLAYGKGIKNVGRLSDLSIYDVMPTVLHMMGVPIPNDVDGRVLHEILE